MPKSAPGLQRVRDNLQQQLRDLNKEKPRNNADERLVSEITRLESELLVVRDDLVRYLPPSGLSRLTDAPA